MRFTEAKETSLFDAYCKNALDKEVRYLFGVNAEKLLALFYKNADLPSMIRPYGGWEGKLIGGHTMGHYLSALSQVCANPDVAPGYRQILSDKLKHIVWALYACQKNSQGQPGFVWGAEILNPNNVEQQFDNVEKGEGDFWVPWYTLHKLLAGFIDAFEKAEIQEAGYAAIALGDWVCNRISRWSAEVRCRVLSVEYGGMSDSLYTLYRLTGDEKYLNAAQCFSEEPLYESILRGDADYLAGVHANTTIPKVLGALNGYSVTGDKRLLAVAEAFFERVVSEHTYVTGGNSNNERFGRDGLLNKARTNVNCETCNVYNMLKLARGLFAETGNVKYLDYYENAFINSILSSQNPDTGMTTYFQPMASGYFKVFSKPEDNFWCCTGTGMESFTKLSDSIYYVDEREKIVYAALYLASSLNTPFLELKQNADLENSDVVSFEVVRGGGKLALRKPAWTEEFTVKLNGETVQGTEQNGFLLLGVQEGDLVGITLRKRMSAHELMDGDGVYAFKYGPFVLSADLGTEKMYTATVGAGITVPQEKVGDTCVIIHMPVAEYVDNISAHVKRGMEGTFTLTDAEPTLTYSYHFRRYKQRYGIYFKFVQSDATQDEI